MTQLTLAAEPAAVARARRAVREALCETGDADLRDAAVLAVSELVTNAIVHAGTEVGIRIVANGAAVRVEVEDGNVHLPVRRACLQVAATGHGLQIVEEYVDRWSAKRTECGKVVWFEIGHLQIQPSAEELVSDAVSQTVKITLLDVPLLAHEVWQEQAATLLRDYLLFTLDDDPHALDLHVAASEALTIVREQLPTTQPLGDPCAATVNSGDTTLKSSEVVLSIPVASLRRFEILDDLLARAVCAARAGQLLGAPTPPGISVMREWLCGQIAGQARGADPTPWRAAS